MKTEKFNKQGIVERLIAADQEAALLSAIPYSVDVTIVGGSVLILKNLLFRSTPDIDALNIEKSLKNIFLKYDINDRVNAYSDFIPYNYEDRLELIDIGTTTIKFYMLSLADLVIMKLSSDREKDWSDITSANVINALDWDLLENIKENELDHISNERIMGNFKYNYARFVEKYRKE